MNSVNAVEGCQPVDAPADQEHQPERAQEQHDLCRAAEDQLTERGQSADAARRARMASPPAAWNVSQATTPVSATPTAM